MLSSDCRRVPRGLTVVATWVVLPVFLMVGCTTVNVTVPARSATEQLLISTAADRAVARHTELVRVRDKKVFVDVSNLESYDKPYVALAVRSAVARWGGRLVDEKSAAEIILEAASGALSMDKTSTVYGLPQVSVPLPGMSAIPIPELALLKNVRQKGKAKILLLVYEADSRKTLMPPRAALGSTYFNSWWLLFFGPFEFTDLPEWPEEKPEPSSEGSRE